MDNGIINYYSIDDVLNTYNIALVYTDEVLVSRKIPEYKVADTYRFSSSLIVNKRDGGDDNTYYKELTESDRIKFNYILLLTSSGIVSAFVQSRTIDLKEYQVKTITVVFELDVEEQLTNIELNLESAIPDWDMHTSYLMNTRENRAISKTDINKVNTYKPFVSNVKDFKNDSDTVLKYSGSLFTDLNKVVDPYVFEITNIPEDNLISLIELDGELTLAYKDSNSIKFVGNNSVISIDSVIDVTKDYIILEENRIVPLNEALMGLTEPIEINSNMRYVVDSMTGDTYFYRKGSGTDTYGFSYSNKEVYCSSVMQDILENLSHDVPTEFSPSIYIEREYELIAITEGLAVYKRDDKLKLHSSFTTADGTNLVISDMEFIGIISSRVVLVRDLNGVYYLYKLVNNDNVFSWEQIELGCNYLYNIYLIAKHKHTNPLVNLSKFIYKGNLFGYFVTEDNKKYLMSL